MLISSGVHKDVMARRVLSLPDQRLCSLRRYYNLHISIAQSLRDPSSRSGAMTNYARSATTASVLSLLTRTGLVCAEIVPVLARLRQTDVDVLAEQITLLHELLGGLAHALQILRL